MPEPIRLELRITPDVLEGRPNGVTPGRAPEALTYAVLDALHRLYTEAYAQGEPYAHGQVERFTMTFEPDYAPYQGLRPDLHGMKLLRVEAETRERRVPMTAARMEADILGLLATRREVDDD